MSETVPQDRVPAAEHEDHGPVTGPSRRGPFRWVVIGSIVVLVTGGVVLAWRAGVFSPAASPATGSQGASASAAVVRATLTTTEQVGGAIGYGGSYTITAPSPGSTSTASQDQQTITGDQQTVTQDQQAVTLDKQTLSSDQQAASDTSATDDQLIAADQADVSTDQSTLNADQGKETADCAVTSSGATGPDTTACTTDQQQVRTDQATLTTAKQKLAADKVTAKTAGDQAEAKVRSDQDEVTSAQAVVRSAQVKLHDDQAALASLLTTAANPGTTYTWLPAVGQVIRQDQPVYAVSGVPVPLLYGAIPAYRVFCNGMPDGADVGELTHDLITLGYGAGLTQSNHYSAATAAAVRRWQQARALPPTGEILLGDVVFEPAPIRVTSVTPSPGGSVGGGSTGGGGTVLTATGVTPVVTVDLDVTEEYLVKPGDAVTVVLPDGTSTVGGHVESVGTVASCPGGTTTGTGTTESPCSSSSASATATVTVTITLDSTPPGAVLDQAPVNVNITSQQVTGVLAVPQTALLAQPSGGYAVEVVGPGNARHRVPVTVGLSDDANGLVQVTGNLTVGEQVVQAST
jgi:multidrug efflux pump subunit AcrA (membrane-fusion protein)